MNYKRMIKSRILITGLLVLIQAVWFIIFFNNLFEQYVAINITFSILSFLLILYIVSKDDNPDYKIGWLLIIMALPLFGALFYLCFGDKKPVKKLRRKINKEHEEIAAKVTQDEAVLKEIGELDYRALGINRYVLSRSQYPVYKGSDVTYFQVGEDMFAAMLCELEKAEHFIFMEYFIIAEGKMWDAILEVLVRKAKAGVDIRILYDDMGCLTLLPPKYASYLESLHPNIKCRSFNKFVPFLSLVMNNRDHRKILVIDGHTAFNGGINLADEYINETHEFGHWKDVGVCVKGEAVWNFTTMFLEIWNAYHKKEEDINQFRPEVYGKMPFKENGYVQPFGDNPLEDEAIGENIYIEILNQAKKYFYIFTPYLIIDSKMKSALCLAAKRGVDVRIVTPGVPDKKIVYRLTRSYYPPLLAAGVKIYEYTPGFIHAKVFVSDDECAVVGTINMDYRSLYLHFECGTYMYRTSVIEEIKKDAIETIGKSREVALMQHQKGLILRIYDGILRVFAPLF